MWTLKINGKIMQQEQRVRAGNAKAQGVPLPEELAAAIATSAFVRAASRAAEACRMQIGCENLKCTYRGVATHDTGEVREGLNPREKSLVVFEWTLEIDGTTMTQEQRVRADNAKTRGVPFPEELAATVARSFFKTAASSAAKYAWHAGRDGGILKDVSCRYFMRRL